MNKRQLIVATARQTSLTQRQTREALEAILETIASALASGDHVTISGFGRFDTQRYPGRRLHRFDGQGQYTVEERQIPVFRSSKLLRQKLRRKDP
jgi:integration host factor subunit beta